MAETVQRMQPEIEDRLFVSTAQERGFHLHPGGTGRWKLVGPGGQEASFAARGGAAFFAQAAAAIRVMDGSDDRGVREHLTALVLLLKSEGLSSALASDRIVSLIAAEWASS